MLITIKFQYHEVYSNNVNALMLKQVKEHILTISASDIVLWIIKDNSVVHNYAMKEIIAMYLREHYKFNSFIHSTDIESENNCIEDNYGKKIQNNTLSYHTII